MAQPNWTMGRKTPMPLKLLVDTRSNKVLFAEAGAWTTWAPPNCSIKSCLLRPKTLHPEARELRLLLQGCDGKSPLAKQKLYTCAGHCAIATVETKATCPRCGQAMSTQVAFSLTTTSAAEWSSDESGGYVKGLVTYMVTDGLEVTPMAAISSIKNIRDVELEEKDVSVGMDEGLAILKAALRSDTVLSDVFLARNK